MDQEIRFCTTSDDVRIAYATAGAGPPLVKAANWLNHLEFDWQSPVWRDLLEALARDHLLVRYDERGNGLSDWNAPNMSFEALVADLEAVVDAAGLTRFALLGISQGGGVAIEYAVRHPERVSHLILLGAYARGWEKRGAPETAEARRALITLMKQGWGQDNPAFRQVFTTLYIPDATPEQMAWFNDLQRMSTSPANAVRLMTTFGEIDVTALLSRVAVPTLVLHARNEAVVPFEEGRLLAARIPGARLVALESRNHLPMPGEPAAAVFLRETRRFLAPSDASAVPLAEPASRTGRQEIARGDRIGRYEILARVGAGGMGIVFRARDTKLRRDVAIKILGRQSDDSEGAERRLLREARNASALNHPSICTIFEVDESDGRFYIVMEYVEGRPLSESIPATGLPIATALAYSTQIAEALAHAHARGIVHRDLKSANVAVTAEGRAKVLDFGLSKQAPIDQARDLATREPSLTAHGMVVGTVAYMAPEVLRGAPADARSDIWSFGVMLYEMVSGKRPFEGQTGFDLPASILFEPAPPLPLVIPERARTIVGRCLEKDPERRYQHASDLRADLEAASGRA